MAMSILDWKETVRKLYSKQPRSFPNEASWQTVGGKRCYFRSKLEHEFAQYLQKLKDNKFIADWFFEVQTFVFEGIKKGVTTYKPDFKIIYLSGKHKYAETKGYMDRKSQTKIKRFKKFYPDETLLVIRKEDMKNLTQSLTYLKSGGLNGLDRMEERLNIKYECNGSTNLKRDTSGST